MFKGCVPTLGNVAFLIELMEILQCHRTDLKMHDKIMNLLDEYLRKGKLNYEITNLSTRNAFMHKVHREFNRKELNPKRMLVTVSDGSNVTTLLFDLEHTILILLPDESM